MKSRNPFSRFKQALNQAKKKGIILPNAMALATTDGKGKPSVRMMLLKGASEKGFVFYTNLKSRKAGELSKCSNASLCFWWPQLEEQMRVEGSILPVQKKEADLYFASRPRGSQLAAWASQQSKRLSSRKRLIEEYRKLEKLYKGQKVPRPPFWSGYRLVPKKIEFWFGKPDRLHERILYTRRGSGRWTVHYLQP